MQKNGFTVIHCPIAADTTIIKTTLITAKDSQVNVSSDDTDIFMLLIHHITKGSTNMYNIYITK